VVLSAYSAVSDRCRIGTDVSVAAPYLKGMRVRTLRMKKRISLIDGFAGICSDLPQ
jgi:hypothetical protein